MAISIRGNAGAWVASNATTQTVTLPAHVAGDMLIVRVAQKPYSAAPTCATSGWAAAGAAYANGATANGNGVGSVILITFWKIATSGAEPNPVITWNTTSNPGACCPVVYQCAATEAFIAAVGAGGGDATLRTAHTATISSHISTTAGDMVDFFTFWGDNYAATLPTFTQTGLTLGTVAEQPDAALSSATGFDCAADGGYRLVTAGTSSAAAVVTGTFGNSEQGGSWTTRLRVAPNANASVTATGGGVTAISPTSAHNSSATATGGGVVTASAKGAHNAAVTVTGGGVLTSVGIGNKPGSATATGAGLAVVDPIAGRQVALAATGGGVLVHDYAVSSAENHNASVVATGSGAAAVEVQTARFLSATGTGAGLATVAPVAGRIGQVGATGAGAAGIVGATSRNAELAFTGGGTMSPSVVAARQVAMLLSGGGVLTSAQATARLGSVTATGGGVATVDGTSAENHSASITATGGGRMSVSIEAAHQLAAAMTGGGRATIGITGAHLASFGMTGSGLTTLEVTASRPGQPSGCPLSCVDLNRSGLRPTWSWAEEAGFPRRIPTAEVD